jgi:hypothetical protein
MNQWLAEMYGTGTQAEEAQEKVAELELFAKLAADNGIDLTTLQPEQVSSLYAETFGKLAQEEGEDESEEHEASESKEKEKGEDEEEKEKESQLEAAESEHAAAKEAAAKFAEADIMGRTMAHAFVNELQEIDQAKEAAGRMEAVQKGAKKLYGAAAKKAKQVGRAEKGFSKGVGERLMGAASKAGKKTGLLKKNLKGTAGTKRTVGRAALAAGALGGAAGAAGAAKALKKESSVSQLDMLAAEEAVKIAEAGGWDTDECIELLENVLTEGPGESEKIAFVEDTNDAIQVRGLELLEKCGYDVNWDSVFGTGEEEEAE